MPTYCAIYLNMIASDVECFAVICGDLWYSGRPLIAQVKTFMPNKSTLFCEKCFILKVRTYLYFLQFIHLQCLFGQFDITPFSLM